MATTILSEFAEGCERNFNQCVDSVTVTCFGPEYLQKRKRRDELLSAMQNAKSYEEWATNAIELDILEGLFNF